MDLGRYELEERIGRGGGGEVWAAWLRGPAGFSRRVAVKLLPENQRSAEQQGMLLREARFGGLVSHPNVVSTQELGCHDGRWFLVMDLVRGQSASGLAKAGPIAPAALLDLASHVCSGLHHIHELTNEHGQRVGLVHRDIKPANILVEVHGVAKIADLGIARWQGTDDVVAGTPGYMPAEQYAHREDARSDLFALGVTLVRLALGEMPFGTGRRAMVLVHHVDDTLRKTDTLRRLDGVVPGLGDVVARALHQDPSRRWPSAAAMGTALESLYATCPRSERLPALMLSRFSAPAPLATPTPTSIPSDAYIGRERELQALGALLDGPPSVIVIKGPGGVGKTRLAHTAVAGRPHHTCDCTNVVTAYGLCNVVATAIGGSLVGEPEASVATLLAHRDTVLVLDNVEQVAAIAKRCLERWSQAAPKVRFLATSRIAIKVPQAVELRLKGLSTGEAAELFRVRLGTPIAPKEERAILRHVERLPLAIELVAAQTRQLGVGPMLERLEREGLVGQRSLRHSIEASWRLLPPESQRALTMLSAYVGDFDERDAAAVLDPNTTPLAVLEALIDHSLLHVRRNAFRLLPSVRDFVRQQHAAWAAVGERRHGRWLAQRGTPAAVLNPMLGRSDELLSAYRRARDRGDVPVAVATALALGRNLLVTGPLTLAETVLEEASGLGHRTGEVGYYRCLLLNNTSSWERLLQVADETLPATEGRLSLRVALLKEYARLHLGHSGSYDRSVALCRAQEAAGEPGYVLSLAKLTLAHAFISDNVERGHVDTLELSQACAAMRGHRSEVDVLGRLGSLFALRGNFTDALSCLRRASALATAGENSSAVTTHSNLLEVLLWNGEVEEACQLVESVVAAAKNMGHPTWAAAAFWVRARLALALHRDDEAEKEASRALAIVGANPHVRGESLLIVAQVAARRGDQAAARVALEALRPLAPRLQRETRAWVALCAVQIAPLREADALLSVFGTDPMTQYPPNQILLLCAHGHLAQRQGRVREARGCLLQASLALAALDMSPHALMVKEVERLRDILAAR